MKRAVTRSGFVSIAFTALDDACNFVTSEMHHLRRNGFPAKMHIVIVPGGSGAEENPAASVAIEMFATVDEDATGKTEVSQ